MTLLLPKAGLLEEPDCSAANGLGPVLVARSLRFRGRQPGVAPTGALTEKDGTTPRRPARGLRRSQPAFEDDMPTFTVHVPSGIVDDVERADRTIFVRDAFSLPGFVFGPYKLASFPCLRQYLFPKGRA